MISDEIDIKLDSEITDTINSQDYVKSVVDLGDVTEVVASEDILTASLHKLIQEGTKIDSSFYEKLIQHKLLKPIDHSVIVIDGITPGKIISDATIMVSTDTYLNKMFFKQPEVPVDIFKKLHIENALSLKLTIAKQNHPRLYHHSIKVALTAIYFGYSNALPNSDLIALATAGLFHDIGELHLNPEIQDQDKPLCEDDWHQIYAHPFISYLILKEFPHYHPTISTIVLEHHEKIDGSGYPRGLSAGETSELGKILSISEMFIGLTTKSFGLEHITSSLKLNTNHYDRKYISILVDVLRDKSFLNNTNIETGQSITTAQIKASAIISTITEWEALMKKLNDSQKNQMLVDTINVRLEQLTSRLMDTGIDMGQVDEILSMLESDPEMIGEVNIIADEALYQLRSIVEEVKRRWPKHSDPHKPRTLGGFLHEWIEHTENIIIKTHMEAV